jgi:hypothetical protein
MAHQHKTEMTWSYEEIAQVLKAAEFLKSKGSTIKLNVSAFCQEIGLSRKNAYKHKRHFDQDSVSLRQQLAELQSTHNSDNEKIRLLETRLAEAEKHEKLRLVLCDLVDDYQKKEPGWTPRRQRLLDESNRISASLGLEPLSLWD